MTYICLYLLRSILVMEKKKVILVWFRNDLRLHDNEVLLEAVQKGDVVIPVYCFDPRYYQENQFGNKNTGVLRAKFTIETVAALKADLNGIGSDLMTFQGLPEEIIPRLVAKYEVDEVFHHREVASRETMISENVEGALWQSNKINLRHFIGHTMYHKEDLPFPIRDIPDSFAIFKKKVERESQVRRPLPAPEHLVSPNHLETTIIPSLEELGFSAEEVEHSKQLQWPGGEQHGLSNLQWVLDPDYHGLHDFSLISPYISIGALSPVLVYHQLIEAENVANKKRHERRIVRLLWRDYFRFMLKKYTNVYFKEKGLGKSTSKIPSSGRVSLTNWKTGKTGETFVDQSIATLLRTGNLPYDMRTIVGLYMIQETGANWLEGVSFFEEHLLDYTPATIYGYWAHYAAVGTSSKDNINIRWQDYLKKSYPRGFPVVKPREELCE